MATPRITPTESKIPSAEESKTTPENIITPDELADFPKGFNFARELGAGAYGTAQMYVHSRTRNFVVVKRVKDVFEEAEEAVRHLREIQILGSLDHPKILKMLHVKPADSNDVSKFNEIFIILEYKSISLQKCLDYPGPMPKGMIPSTMAQIFQILIYLDKVQLMHRDIKPDNILVDDGNLTLCDFNLSRFSHTGRRLSFGESITTPNFRAPEVILASEELKKPVVYDRRLDLWAAGIILIQLLKKEHNLDHNNPLHLEKV